jgi:hypothetical protein
MIIAYNAFAKCIAATIINFFWRYIMSTAFFIPAYNLMGAGCLIQATGAIKSHGFKKY